ncbi:hypothetical protein Nepgr_000964 [Nepenthes gracilis]|uniref:Pentatricopeptide repeat-containing protein n=1 Tax=Nepenthes gracilis TaxID=150966 RepID=A0AAD3P599_NEPGR|nr:hypothetical protein Nepgr_000964 [Nepenthes gracilis]
MEAWSLSGNHPSVFLQETAKEKRPVLNCQLKLSNFTALAGKVHKAKIRADYAQLRPTWNNKQTPQEAHLDLLHKMRSMDNFRPKRSAILNSTMLQYANNGNFHQAQIIWNELINSSFMPSVQVVSCLITAYSKWGHFSEVTKILNQISSRKCSFSWLPQIYSLAISCFGMGGKLDLMEMTLTEMVSKGFPVDSATGNAYVIYYSMFGSLMDMEAAYGRLKRSQILIEEQGIKAVSFAYIKQRRFYKLGEFLRDVGLARRNVGNLLWNLLLLSYAANFKMKSLQREFLAMVESGFHPNVTTFNIRLLAFSKMNLFWDLHLSLEHLKNENIVPDLVTYGCVVDAYIDKRMGKNLDFALDKMCNLDDPPLVATEPLVFEVLGKGDFQSSSEAFMEFSNKQWTYRKLIRTYLKKKQRSNQVFWNY